MTPLSTISAADLLMTQMQELRWAIEGILPEGVAILAGRPKAGKSWLILHFAIEIAAGGKVFGQIPVEGAPVLYLALEDNNRRLKDRITKLMGPHNLQALHNLTLATTWPHSDGLKAIEDWLKQHTGTAMVVVDTLARFENKQSRSGYAYDDDYAAIGQFAKLSTAYNTTFLIITHTRKAGKEDPQDFVDEVNATTGLTGAADIVMVLLRPRNSDKGKLMITGRDIDEMAMNLRWNDDTCFWSIEPTDLTAERATVLSALDNAKDGLGTKDIAQALNKPYQATAQLLRRMLAAGQLNQPSYGTYRHPKFNESTNEDQDRQEGTNLPTPDPEHLQRPQTPGDQR